MKTKLFFTVILVISVVAFLFKNPSAGLSPPQQGGSPFNSTYFINALDYGAIGTTNQYHDSLYFNLWHEYPQYGLFCQNGWTNRAPADLLTADISDYGTQVQNILNTNNSDGMKTLMHRVKIDYLAMGQRSDYQCEDSSDVNPDYWFYTYYKHNSAVSAEYQDNTSFGNGIYARYSRTENSTNQGPWIHTAGYVVDSLIANREQINYTSYSSRYMADHFYPWHIKPRIRIDSAYANNLSNLNTKVCRVDILDFNGNTIKRADIKVRNFKKALDSLYNGQYLEEFYFVTTDWQDTSTLKIDPISDPNHPGELGYNTNPFNPNHESIWNMNCAVDFRVWWYGNCDMWLDYVRVDNEIAHQLFRGDFETPQNNWFQWEVQLADYNNSAAEFYVEEFEFNMVPCMSYVAKKIREYSDDKFNLMCVLNYGEYVIHQPVPWDHQFDMNYIRRNLIDTLQLREFCDFAYPFNGYMPGSANNNVPVFIPNTLPDTSFSMSEGRLSLSRSPSDYDFWLQGYMDENSSWFNDNFIKWMKHGDEISKLTGLPFVNLPQTHLWYSYEYMLREPTNEEIEMMVNVSVSYGARSQLYFMYSNWGTIGDTTDKKTYGRGMTGGYPNSNSNPRTENVYGQNKWTAIKDINRKLNTWGPSLMSFNNADRHSYIYRLADERTNCLNETYFSDIVTYYPSNIPPSNCNEDAPDDPTPPQNWQYDCKGARYLQAAVFKNLGEVNPNYFMIVNRRCAPYLDQTTIDRNGGYRKIKVKFDVNHSALSGYNEWVIKDVANPTWEKQFNKTQQLYIELGNFMPGEGRLYHLVPVQ